MGKKLKQFKELTFHLLEPTHKESRLSIIVSTSIMLLIAVNVLAVMLETVDTLMNQYAYFF